MEKEKTKKEKERYTIYVPGEKLPNPTNKEWIYETSEGPRAAVLGVFDNEKKSFIPLKTQYLPKVGDQVIGVVEEERPSDYVVNIFSPYPAYVKKKMEMELKPFQTLLGEITFVTEIKTAFMNNIKILTGGNLITISPSKVPRVIGKKGSMLNLLKSTGCEIIIGKNGIIWIRGKEKEVNKATLAILKIEREAHISGLTDRIKKFIEG